MNQENFLSILRFILTSVGSYLVGREILNTQVDDATWQGWAGGIIALASTIWGIVSKTATVEMVQSGLRSVIVVGGGIALANGVINEKTLESIIGIVTIVVTMIYSQVAKKKSKNVATGETKIIDLKGAEAAPQISPNTSTIKSK